jgi:hypothetical protein
MLALLGLKDSYVHDGRVLTDAVEESAQPVRLRGHADTVQRLSRLYKQINAPFGELAANAIRISTHALGSGDAVSDSLYIHLSDKLTAWTARRNSIAGEMKAMLDGAAFNDRVFDEPRGRQLVEQAQALLDEVQDCAADPAVCAQ